MNRIVAIYARVSTEHEAQLSALENQVQYYENLLALHPEWKLYKQYIDEGITGTSVKKRRAFLEMMRDAENGCFDLIVTREVSRFARNTVDTLSETRKLKRMGVEVYFTEDNIWTMNDEDGELRLTIMATLAQNESKKTSIRVKAGQMVSFQNAVPYGNGNILGYDRVGKTYVINPEQAETVRKIYNLYLQGNGLKKIQYELERQGVFTSTGLPKWSCSNISRVLRNPFYTGTIVYRKNYVPDYLEQKKIRNRGEVEQVVVEGKHVPIISKEEFEAVQEKLKAHIVEDAGKRVGKRSPENIWCKKLVCPCGCHFNRKVWTKTPKGGKKYCFQCYGQKETGSVTTRKNHGLSLAGVCTSPVIPEWKLILMMNMLLSVFMVDRQRVLNIAKELLEANIHEEINEENRERLKQYENKLRNLEQKKERLVELRINGDIELDPFQEKKARIENDISEMKKKVDEYRAKNVLTPEDLQKRLKVLEYAMEQDFRVDGGRVPDTIIDAFVKEIIVQKDCFCWKLNLFDGNIYTKAEGTAWNPKLLMFGEGLPIPEDTNKTIDRATDETAEGPASKQVGGRLPIQAGSSTGCY